MPTLYAKYSFVLSFAAGLSAIAQTPTHQSIVHNQAGSQPSVVNGVASDADGNLLVTGWRSDALDFGGTAHPQGAGAIFLAKFDPQGNELWSKVSGSADQLGNHKGMSVAVDGNGNVYNAGWVFVAEQATFDGATLPQGTLGFVAKYSPSGALMWVKDFSANVNAIAVDGNGTPFINLGDGTLEKLDPGNGNSVATATCSGDLQNVLYHNIDIDGSNNVIAQWGNKITKHTNGLTPIWSTPLVKSVGAESYRVSVDGNGDVWATFYGIFGTVTLGGVDYTSFPGGYVYRLDGASGTVLSCTSPGAYKYKKVFNNGNGGTYVQGDFAFNQPALVEYDGAWTALWSVNTFDTKDIALVDDACFVLGGQHSTDITLDGTTYTRPNASGQENAIAGHLCAGNVGIADPTAATSLEIMPNPANDLVQLSNTEAGFVRFIDPTGKHLRTVWLSVGRNAIDLTGLPQGLLLLRNEQGRSYRLLHLP